MLELMQAWLSLFGDPGVFLLNEGITKIPGKGQGVDWQMYYGLENSREINQQKSYGLFFSPNGNLGKVNKVGSKVLHKIIDCEDYISCLYIDLDKNSKNCSFKDKSMEEYFDYVKETINNKDFRCQYIVQSGGGFHLYSFIFPEFREEAALKCKADWKLIQTSLASMFDGGDAASHSVAKLMRMPFSNHWKTHTPKPVKLWEVVGDEDGKKKFVEVTKPEQITLEGKALIGINGLLDFVENQRPHIITNPKGQDVTLSPKTVEINKLPIVDVIRKLEGYPRQDERKNDIIFKTDGNRIWFVINGQTVYTDGYKINKSKNYVNNFSLDQHPRDERPAGPVYVFLLNYFNRDMMKMGDFLKAEYDIDFLEGGKETFLKLPTDKGVIMFQDDGVYYRTTKSRGKETEDANEKLFDVPFIIKGGMRVGYDRHGEIDDKNYYYIISLLDKDIDDPEEMIIEYKPDKARFNNDYGKKGISFTKTDLYLVDFYSALKAGLKNGLIRRYTYINQNGYYPNMYVEGDRIYNVNGDDLDTSGLPLKFDTPDIDTISIRKEVSMVEYGEMLRKVFVDEESILCYITFLVLVMGDKFRNCMLEGNTQQIILPGLFISGKTKSGKSTMVNLLLNGFGLSSNCRRASVKGTTLQPLKQSATDDFILHWEEFTGRGMTEEKENLIRDVLNKTKTARGMIDGTNAKYTYRSSLVLDGERLPDSESVINRCVVVPFNLKGRIGTMEQLRAFSGVGFKRDFITSLYEIDPDKVKEDFYDAQDRCIKNGILDRYSMIYGFLLCVNQWFNIFLEEELLAVIKKNLKESDELDREQTPLASILNEVINEYKVKPTISEEGEGIYKVIIPIPTKLISQVKLDIMDMMKTYGSNRMIFPKGNIVITLYSNDESEINKELYNTIILYKSHFNISKFMDLDGFIYYS